MGPQLFDVVVAGAGPAGAATARRLALRGCRVAMVERSRFVRPRIGESFAPDLKPLLQALGVWDDFLALKPQPSWGVRSRWGDDAAQMHSHLFSPHGCGWHVDRCAFDRMLAHAAVKAGARLYEGVTVQRVERAACDWAVALKANDAEAMAPLLTDVRARVVVDATGRSARLARHLGAQAMRFDRMVGIAAHLQGVTASARGHLMVEAIDHGWWYFAPLPGDTLLAMLMTDADLCTSGRLQHAAAWNACLLATTEQRDRLHGMYRVSSPQVHCAVSQRVKRGTGTLHDTWLSVGDAALSVDPISGSGVLRALKSAHAAAAAVLEMLGGQAPIEAYEQARDRECTEHLYERADYYAMEQRWPDAVFWKRRAVLARHAVVAGG